MKIIGFIFYGKFIDKYLYYIRNKSRNFSTYPTQHPILSTKQMKDEATMYNVLPYGSLACSNTTKFISAEAEVGRFVFICLGMR